MSTINRKNFILNSVSIAAGIILLPGIFSNRQQSFLQNKPAVDPELVKQFVGVAHKDMEKVKFMLQETPDLLNSVNNLGGWDWEDAIGAAGHVALFLNWRCFLLEKGGRKAYYLCCRHAGKNRCCKSIHQGLPANEGRRRSS